MKDDRTVVQASDDLLTSFIACLRTMPSFCFPEGFDNFNSNLSHCPPPPDGAPPLLDGILSFIIPCAGATDALTAGGALAIAGWQPYLCRQHHGGGWYGFCVGYVEKQQRCTLHCWTSSIVTACSATGAEGSEHGAYRHARCCIIFCT